MHNRKTWPIDHVVYTFLKEMKVKGTVDDIHEDHSNMVARRGLKNIFKILIQNQSSLVQRKKNYLRNSKTKFYDELADSINTSQFFGQIPTSRTNIPISFLTSLNTYTPTANPK
jgi:hypothetical protein